MVTPFDDTWYKYSMDLRQFYNADGSEVSSYWDEETWNWVFDISVGNTYYYKFFAGSYDGAVANENAMTITVVAEDDPSVCLKLDEAKYLPTDADNRYVGAQKYVFNAEAGHTYQFELLGGIDNEYHGLNILNDWDWIGFLDAMQTKTVITFSEDTTVTLEFWMDVFENMEKEGDGLGLLVTEKMGVGDTADIAFAGTLGQVKFTYTFDEDKIAPAGNDDPEVNGIEILCLDANDEIINTITYDQFDDYGITFGLVKIVRNKEVEVVPDSLGHIPVGTYYFNYYIPQMVEKDDDGEFINDGLYTDLDHPINVVACAKSYKVTFNTNYPGTLVANKTAAQTIYNNKETALTSTKALKIAYKGYTFLGWDTDPAGETVVYEDSEKVFNLTEGEATVQLYGVWKITDYNINWHLAGGEWTDDFVADGLVTTYTIESEEVVLPDASVIKPIDGYVFAGWYTTTSYTAKTKAKNIATGTIGDKDFYAKWTPISYTVKFEGNGNTKGGATKNQTVLHGQEATLTANGFKDARAFMYWSYDADGEDVAFANKGKITISDSSVRSHVVEETNEETGVTTRTLTLYANWKGTFEIEYDLDGGVINESATNVKITSYTYGKVSKLPTPTKAGYTFMGWYKTRTGAGDSESPYVYTNRITSIAKTYCEDLHLYAWFAPNTYTISFGGNGGSGKTASIKVVQDAGPVAFTPNGFVKPGHVFLGWTLASYGKKAVSLPAGTTMRDAADIIGNYVVPDETMIANPGANLSLVAVWAQTSYTATLDANGGLLDDPYDATSTGNEYIDVDYNYNAKAVAKKTDGSLFNIALYKPTRAGFTFAGWYRQDTNAKVTTTKGLYGDVTLYAKWTANYKIKFDANGGTLPPKKKMADLTMVNGVAKALTANQFTYSDANGKYIFLGWTLDPKAPNSILDSEVDFMNSAKLTGDEILQKLGIDNVYDIPTTDANGVPEITLYAVWRNEYNINYVLGDTYGTTAYMPSGEYCTGYTYGGAQATYTLPTPVREGYTFAGWYKDAKFKTKVTAITNKMSGDITLYAKWTGLKYTVTFNANAPEGTKAAGKTANAAMVYGTAKALTKNGFKVNGYRFVGWSTTPYGSFQVGEDSLAEDAANYGNAVKLTDYNDVASGYVDMGDYNPKITLYAVWIKEQYSVTYVMNGFGEQIPEVKYTVEDEVILAPEPTQPGYTFLGFYTDKACKKKATNLKVGSTGDKVIYVKWVPNK